MSISVSNVLMDQYVTKKAKVIFIIFIILDLILLADFIGD